MVDGDDDEHAGHCECRMCGSEWTVWLTTWQVVRLRVHPPGRGANGPGLRVRELS
ncbi:MAG: hypothetical protein JHC95_10785 [Solirubrobacteraceae bacterium]|nr:hypothetical protein [Solirubrobacteraceae bacterium]